MGGPPVNHTQPSQYIPHTFS